MLKSSLCIDLGAAFTKVAYRESPESTSHLLRHSSLNFDESRFCIPSVAAHNRRTDVWVFGTEPMEYKAGGSVEVFRNWKADLFQQDAGGPLGGSFLEDASPQLLEFLRFTYPHLQAREVAVRYLRWLHHEMIPEMLGKPISPTVEVQLCVPEFVIQGTLGPLMEQIMAEAGFENTGLYTLSEPKANLVGVLTEGRNVLTRTGRPSRTGMFGDSHIIGRLSHEGEAVLFVDVGAYTTDLALADFSTDSEGSFAHDPSHSTSLGVSLLDKMIVARLDPDQRAIFETQLTPAEWEQIHAVEYGGERHFLGEVSWVPSQHGQTLPQDLVQTCLEEFASAISQSVRQFLGMCRYNAVRIAVLTGGGCNLAHVSHRLARDLAALGITILYAPESTRVPPELEKHSLNQELVRGSSGIGGASILFAKH